MKTPPPALKAGPEYEHWLLTHCTVCHHEHQTCRCTHGPDYPSKRRRKK
jgi:hypothetical protein